MTEERKAFEEWIRQKAPLAEFERTENGEYLLPSLREAWEVWQASATRFLEVR